MEDITFVINKKELKIQATGEFLLKLKEDDEFTIKYITRLVSENKLNEIGLYSNESENLEIVRGAISPTEVDNEDVDKVIWVGKGKPTKRDRDAFQLMLDLRASERYVSLFNNKQTVKSQVWAKIGAEMTAAGFNLGPTASIPEKMRQKFMNLSRTYNQYNHYVKTTTGTEPKQPPEYYDDIHKILGDKHKSHPPLIEESMKINKPSTSYTSEDDSSVMNVSDTE